MGRGYWGMSKGRTRRKLLQEYSNKFNQHLLPYPLTGSLQNFCKNIPWVFHKLPESNHPCPIYSKKIMNWGSHINRAWLFVTNFSIPPWLEKFLKFTYFKKFPVFFPGVQSKLKKAPSFPGFLKNRVFPGFPWVVLVGTLINYPLTKLDKKMDKKTGWNYKMAKCVCITKIKIPKSPCSRIDFNIGKWIQIGESVQILFLRLCTWFCTLMPQLYIYYVVLSHSHQ